MVLPQPLLKPFNPRALPNLAVWRNVLNRDNLTFNSTTVSALKNRGTKGVADAIQATALRQPLYVSSGINGRPALEGRHDGTNASQLRIADHAGLNYISCEYYGVVQRVTDMGGTETIVTKYVGTGNQRDMIISFSTSDFPTTVLSGDGTSGTNTTAQLTTALATGGSWHCRFPVGRRKP
jgi:hypothetical protein